MSRDNIEDLTTQLLAAERAVRGVVAYCGSSLTLTDQRADFSQQRSDVTKQLQLVQPTLEKFVLLFCSPLMYYSTKSRILEATVVLDSEIGKYKVCKLASQSA